MEVERWGWTLRRARTLRCRWSSRNWFHRSTTTRSCPDRSAHALPLQRLLALVERALPRLQLGLLLLEQLAAQVHADLAEVDLMGQGAPVSAADSSSGPLAQLQPSPPATPIAPCSIACAAASSAPTHSWSTGNNRLGTCRGACGLSCRIPYRMPLALAIRVAGSSLARLPACHARHAKKLGAREAPRAKT